MADSINLKPKTKLTVSVDFRWVSVALLVIIAVLIVAWKPWSSIASSDRTVSVTGTAIVKAEPDEFGFSPSYEFKNVDKTAAGDAIAKKSNEVVSGLKKLGVQDKDLKNYSSGYGSFNYNSYRDGDNYIYSVTIQVAVDNKELAQKVQDYLLTTSPMGQITPYNQFSQAKQRELEDQARDKANDDARAKAEKSAKSLGYKLGKVKSVSDGSGFGGPITLEAGGKGGDVAQPNVSSTGVSLAVLPGQNEVSYSVTVIYYVK